MSLCLQVLPVSIFVFCRQDLTNYWQEQVRVALCSINAVPWVLQVLVTGSLYLVGDVLKLLNKAPV